ncbi:MFS general substrate transporter [Backusella circina FSU 941]|nr:MFS general substrate transporter [Backusella circina FSU 941]
MLYFNTNITVINATISIFLLVNGIAPLFWAPLSERIGRRWVYITTLALYTVCTIICGTSSSIGVFFAFRMLQGIFACGGQAVGGGTVSDLFEPKDRGKATGIFILGTILGPTVAPICGGYVDQYLGWRWIFYIKTIMGGVLTILTFVFVKETLYIPNPPPPPVNFKERLGRLKFNPLESLGLLLNIDIFLTCLPVSVAFGWFYLLVTVFPLTFGPIYKFSTGTIGLCFLACGIGNIAGALSAGFTSDKYYNMKIKRNNGIIVKEFRLHPILFGLPFLVVGSIFYGWFIHARLLWIAPLIALVLTNFGIMFTITTANTYLVDCYIKKSASVVSANNFTRNLLGMMFSLLGVTIRTSLGDGWTYTLMALTCLVFYLVCIPLVLKFGSNWRDGAQKNVVN